jgi:hypothetical protein
MHLFVILSHGREGSSRCGRPGRRGTYNRHTTTPPEKGELSFSGNQENLSRYYQNKEEIGLKGNFPR